MVTDEMHPLEKATMRRIMLRLVRDHMVNIVIAFPPSKTESTQVIRDDDANSRVDVEVVSDTHMSGIMGRKDQLVPKESEEQSTQNIPLLLQQIHGCREEHGISYNLKAIR